MKLLLVTGSFPPMRCGVGDYSWKLAKALADAGVSVGVLTGVSAAGGQSPAGVTVFPVIPNWRLSAISKVRRVMREWQPDVVHVQYPTQGYGPHTLLPSLLPLLAWTSGISVVRTWHEIPGGREKSFLLQALAPGDYIVTRQTFGDEMPKLARSLLNRSRRHYVPIGSNIPGVELSEEERAQLRARYLAPGERERRIIVYFGFLYRFKGADQLFDICNPTTDHLIFLGDSNVDPDYTAEVARRANKPPWRGHATLIGYLPQEDIGRHLALADAVVLPFRRGGGIGNGTIHAATLQGTPVVTTAREATGYEAMKNTYFAAPDDIPAMRDAVNRLAGRRRPADTAADHRQWQEIAAAHRTAYEQAFGKNER